MFSPANILQASILIVDDKAADVMLLERMLHKAGYVSITATTTPHTVCDLHRENRYDLILLDLQMPDMDGFEIMECLKDIEPEDYLSVLVITALPEHKVRALQIGAKDFISKPFDLPEILARIHNMLEVRLLHRESRHYNLILEQTVQELRVAEAGLRDSETALNLEKAALSRSVLQLRLANENLTLATIEAHVLAEEIERARAQMAYLAQHDALTDLPNRTLLNDRMIQAMALALRQGKQLAVMFLDLDHFKHINDTLGHAVGDQLLQSVAKRLSGSVRSSDTVCRQGGDEFVILLADVDHAQDAALSAQKILTALAAPHLIGDVELTVTMSIGISIYPDNGQDVDTLIKCADITLYYAKEGGRNNYRFFEKDMNARAIERNSIENDMRYALQRQEFILYYQPKIHLKTGVISGVEALLRWKHPHRGLLIPEQFISIAEASGLIIPLGAWILKEVCRQALTWRNEGWSISIAVNISAKQFRHEDFLASTGKTLLDSGLEPGMIEFDFTESMLMENADVSVAVLNALKNLGVRLVIDDFGTGYSNLSYLKRFQIDMLKIDHSFIRDMIPAQTASDVTEVITALVGMGKNLRQHVIAEGVETREQLAFLQIQGCDEAQGYYFSPPLHADDLRKLLQDGIAPDLLT